MRLPGPWNGRFFYQANGGIDGSVAGLKPGAIDLETADRFRCQ